MRLHSKMTREEVRAALTKAATETWGPTGAEARERIIEQAAGNVWRVLQVPLAPLSEEPELAAQSGAGRIADETV